MARREKDAARAALARLEAAAESDVGDAADDGTTAGCYGAETLRVG